MAPTTKTYNYNTIFLKYIHEFKINGIKLLKLGKEKDNIEHALFWFNKHYSEKKKPYF